MVTPTIVSVLRTGGDYGPDHVVALQAGVRRHLPCPHRFLCLSNIAISGVETRPLQRPSWPGWWSKMEMFSPLTHDLGDFLYLDLDTVIVGELTEIATVGVFTVLRDFYHRGRPDRQDWIGSGLMYLPRTLLPRIWALWSPDATRNMQRAGPRGDQGGLMLLGLHHEAERWQDILPHQVVSYKVHVQAHRGQIPPGARVICFHGKPRPWVTDLWPSDLRASAGS